MMGALSNKLRSMQGGIMHYCEGCRCVHPIHLERPNHNGAIWRWDGNLLEPTITPSINIVGHCHYFITKGMIHYLNDCTHALRGLTVPLPQFPGWAEDDDYD